MMEGDRGREEFACLPIKRDCAHLPCFDTVTLFGVSDTFAFMGSFSSNTVNLQSICLCHVVLASSDRRNLAAHQEKKCQLIPRPQHPSNIERKCAFTQTLGVLVRRALSDSYDHFV